MIRGPPRYVIQILLKFVAADLLAPRFADQRAILRTEMRIEKRHFFTRLLSYQCHGLLLSRRC